MATTRSELANAQAMILAGFPPFGFSQAQADIMRTFIVGFGQAQASVVKFAKQAGFAQGQADIKQSYQGYSQAQAFVTI